MALIEKNSNFNAITSEGYKIDTTSGNITATLPDASSCKTVMVFINHVGSNNVILSGTINGATNYTLTPAKSVIIASDGTYFYIAGGA